MPSFEIGDGPNSRVRLLLQEIDNDLARAGNVPDTVKSKLKEARQIVEQQDDYLEKISSDVPKMVNEMIAASDSHDWSAAYKQGKTQFELTRQMCAGAYEASVMQQFARVTGAKRILEIGVFSGTTTAALASLPTLQKIVALDIENYLKEFNTPWWEKMGVADKIDFRIGDGQQSLKDLASEKQQFDIVFIDADKGGYAAYYDLVMSLNLLSPKGFIVADNTAYRGHPWAPSDIWGASLGDAISSFNEKIRNDNRVDVVLLPIRDGMSIIMPRS